MRLKNRDMYRAAGYHDRATAEKAFSGSLALTNYGVPLLAIRKLPGVGYRFRTMDLIPQLIAIAFFLIIHLAEVLEYSESSARLQPLSELRCIP